MAQLIVHDVDFSLVRLLRKRAAKNGRSPEDEHRAILEQALRGGQQPGASQMGQLLAAFGLPPGGRDPKSSSG